MEINLIKKFFIFLFLLLGLFSSTAFAKERKIFSDDYEIHFDGNTDKGIPANDILELIPYMVNRYYFYE